jgi:hypothetical protein
LNEKLMKLMAQFALLFVALWVVAAALGKGDQAIPGSSQKSPNRDGCGGKWRGQYSRYGSKRTLAKYFNASVAQASQASGQSVPPWAQVL